MKEVPAGGREQFSREWEPVPRSAEKLTKSTTRVWELGTKPEGMGLTILAVFVDQISHCAPEENIYRRSILHPSRI